MDNLGLPDGVQYAVHYVPMVRICKCGTKHRVDCSDPGIGCAGQFFQHCAEDDGEYLIGPLLGSYEDLGGKWVPIH